MQNHKKNLVNINQKTVQHIHTDTHTDTHTERDFSNFTQTATSTWYLMEEKTSSECASKRLNHTKFSRIKPKTSTFYYK